MSKRDELKNARDAAMDTIEPYCDKFNSGRSEIEYLTTQVNELEGISDSIRNLYVPEFHASTPQIEDNYLFGNFQSSFEAAIEHEVAMQGLSNANITTQTLLMYRQEEQDLILSSIGPLHNAPELHEMMEDHIALMNQDVNHESFKDEISRCELVKSAIEYNMMDDPNSHFSETTISHSELKLYTIDLAVEMGCRPSVDYVSGMLTDALNEDITHSINTGQKLSIADIHEALDSCNHIDDNVKIAFSNAVDNVAAAESSSEIAFD